MDVVASLYDRNSIHDLISRTASEVFIPLTVGGGIRSLEDIKTILRAGADKVSLNTAAIKDPGLISSAARYFGSSTIVVSIEAIKNPDGKYYAYTDNGRQETGVEVIGWAKRATELGAGEIMITSVDREGTGSGFDLDLVKAIEAIVDVPLIVHGGAGKADDVSSLFMETQADAVALASILHYEYIASQDDFGHSENEGNIEFLKNKRSFKNIQPAKIPSIKKLMTDNGVSCRI